ncbi:MAG: carboxypeptidase regulatory-like domain-containing protein [Acidobacteria bacterium]|nr:carboxypeptidase regulatory-like domain-containing protein [Acidobacteriota bacterium]
MRHVPSTFARLLGACAVAGVAFAGVACGGGNAPASSADTGAATTLDPASTGPVTGRVVLAGTPPAAQTIRVDGDKTCATLVPGAERKTESYVVGDGGTLANVFVYVKTGLEGRSFPVPSEPVVVDQQRCWYTPRVVGVRVGQPFQVLNSDPLLHNVRAEAAINQPFNQGQPVQGVRYSHTFSTDEVMVALRCDVHAWMNAWVGVMNHPYFTVTGADGAFSLPNLPAGTYTVEAWHEAAGTTTGTVTVTAQGTATLDLTFAVPAA